MAVCRLDQLKEGECAEVIRLDSGGTIRRRLQDMGLVAGSTVKCLGRSPLGDPAAYDVCGAVLALRDDDAHSIFVEKGVGYGSY